MMGMLGVQSQINNSQLIFSASLKNNELANQNDVVEVD
jgi:hypothetical protein